jgi:DNA polymerase-1
MAEAGAGGHPPGGRDGGAPSPVRALLVDGHSLVFRAFYALPPLTDGEGRPTGALHGFLQMLRRLIEEEKPTHVAVAFDRGRPAFRLEAVPAYKAQREHAPEEVTAQVDALRALLPGLGVAVVEAPGYEGDDVLGTLARRAEAAGGEALLVSGDRDLLQLVDDRVRALFTRRGISDVERWGPAEVERAYGVAPARLPEWKALAGDSSDNLPGVPGIGPKGASALLAGVGSLEELLAGGGDGVSPRHRALLAEHAAACLRQRDAATIRVDVPLEVDLEALRFTPGVRPEAAEMLRAFGLRGVLERWPGGAAAPSPAPRRPAPAEPSSPEAVGVWAEVEGPPGRRRLRALAVWADGEGRAVAAGEDGAPPSPDEAVWRLLADPARPKAGFGLKELWAWCAASRRVLADPLVDLGVVAYLLEPGRSAYPPEFVAARLGAGASWPAQEGAGVERARAAAALVPAAREALERDGMEALYREVEGPLMPVLAAMEETGIAVDRAVLTRLGEEFAGRIAALEGEIHALAKGPFNVNSPRQLADVLFGRLSLPVVRRTKTGPSTDADVLQELAPMHPIVALVLLHRQLQKLRSTYVEGLVPLIGPDGRLHTTFHQTVAATGRLSSADPNLQNIPVRLEEGRRVRAAFVASPGHRLLAADYSQIELRVLAHLSGDEALCAAFRGGRDVHAETAAAVFGVPAQAVTPDMRRRAKAVNFGIVYGISAFGLARDLGIGVGEAQAFIDAYFERHPRVRAFLEDTVAEARRLGYTRTPDGRRRYLPDLLSRRPQARAFAERAAKNSPIQGMAADIIKRAMVASRGAALPGRLLLQVHDELIFEVPEGEVDRLAAGARALLEGAARLDVPLEVEVKVGSSWATAAPYAPDGGAAARAHA